MAADAEMHDDGGGGGSKASCTLNIEDETVLYALQQRPLNGPLNLEDAVGCSIYRVSLNGPLYI
jgi:hypothetical protein